MHYLYIIHSTSLDKYYVGETPDIDNRIEQHNSHYFKKGFTKAAEDWEIVLTRKCILKEDALYLEKFIKRMKSRKFIEKIIRDNSILDDIISKKMTWFPRGLGAGGTTKNPAFAGFLCLYTFQNALSVHYPQHLPRQILRR